MENSDTPELDQLSALAEQAEQILATRLDSHDIRQACALARGYLDLARYYHEPVKVEDLERIIAKMRTLLASCADKAALDFRPREAKG
jgi:hypothetical protein